MVPKAVCFGRFIVVGTTVAEVGAVAVVVVGGGVVVVVVGVGVVVVVVGAGVLVVVVVVVGAGVVVVVVVEVVAANVVAVVVGANVVVVLVVAASPEGSLVLDNRPKTSTRGFTAPDSTGGLDGFESSCNIIVVFIIYHSFILICLYHTLKNRMKLTIQL